MMEEEEVEWGTEVEEEEEEEEDDDGGGDKQQQQAERSRLTGMLMIDLEITATSGTGMSLGILMDCVVEAPRLMAR